MALKKSKKERNPWNIREQPWRGRFFFFNTKSGISQITYVPYYVAVAMETTFIFWNSTQMCTTY